MAFERVGGTSPIHVDVRLISASNKDPKIGLEEGWFRSDLFYRLNVFQISLPPLRERKSDIPLLIDRFISKYAFENQINPSGISHNALNALMDYSFPGNIRELKNIMERAVILARGDRIRISHLPEEIVNSASSNDENTDYSEVKQDELLTALKEIYIPGNGKGPKCWQNTLKCTTIDKIHEFLVKTCASEFSRVDFTQFLSRNGGSRRNKYGTAGKYLAILSKNGICVHNGKKANQSRFRLHEEFAVGV